MGSILKSPAAPPTIMAATGSAHNAVPRRTVRRIRIPRWAKIVGSVIILIVMLRYIVVPQFSEALSALSSLEHVSVVLVAVAVVLELGSLLAYSGLTATVLGRPRPGYAVLLRIDLTDLGVNHTVPGGGTTAAAARFALFRRAGIPRADAATAAAIQITGSNLILGVLFGVGILLTLTSFTANALYVSAAVATLALLAVTAAAVWLLTRHTNRAVLILRGIARHLRFIPEASAEAFVRTVALRIRMLMTTPKRLGLAVLLGAANWLLDAFCLWIVLAAFGCTLSAGALLTAYGLGSILAMLPLTPGGLGIVEAVMVPALVAFGVSPAIALVSVIAWRLLEYWMPIPLAAGSYLSLRLGALRSPACKAP